MYSRHGYRRGVAFNTIGNTAFGFRWGVNGVWRSGRDGVSSNRVRSGYRYGNYLLTYVNSTLGFRLSEWCVSWWSGVW